LHSETIVIRCTPEAGSIKLEFKSFEYQSFAMNSGSARLRFGLQLVGFARRWRQELDRRLAAVGLTDATWAPLIHLQESGDGISQKDLAALVGIDGSSLVRLLDMLAERRLIERRTDEVDRRARRVFLTPAGREAIQDIRSTLLKAEADMLADLADDEIATILEALEKVDRRLGTGRDRKENVA
jgi:MarR family transcriptional regulator for hemolysin